MHRKNTHSFYVLSTSFLRLFYVIGIMEYGFLHILHIICIFCILEENIYLQKEIRIWQCRIFFVTLQRIFKGKI